MITGFALVCVNVLDMDQARAFYVDALGFEVDYDQVQDGFHWFVVHAPRLPEVPLMLVVPGPPVVDGELAAKGVEFIEEPTERFYGIDAAFRDPFGNHWRLTQGKKIAPPA